MSELFALIAEWITNTVEALGPVGIALLVALETIFPPLPSEAILPVAGFLSAQGAFAFPIILAAATFGSLVGATVLYGFGYAFGEPRVRRFIRAYGKWMLLDEADLNQAEGWFDRHGGKAVFFGRLVPLVRSLISIPAGIARMDLVRFVLYTSLGSGLWNTFLIGTGWVLGDQWEQVRPYTKLMEYVTVLLIAASVVWFVWHRRARVGDLMRRRRSGRGEPEASTS